MTDSRPATPTPPPIKGRGAATNRSGRFERATREAVERLTDALDEHDDVSDIYDNMSDASQDLSAS